MSSNHPSVLPINNLQPNPLQPRGKIKKEDLQELVQSVRTYGILEPIIVAQTPAGYQIIAGERRWRAAKEAGLKEVPVLVKVTTPRGMLEMAIIENVQRVDLSPLERAQAVQQLMRDFGFTTTQVAEKLGKSLAYVSNTIKLLSLPDAIKDGLEGNLITEGHARALAQIGDERKMVECYKIILKENASVRRAEELARQYREEFPAVRKAAAKPVVKPHQLEKWEKTLQSVLGKKSKVKLMQSNRQARMTLVFKGTPEETEAKIQQVIELLGQE